MNPRLYLIAHERAVSVTHGHESISPEPSGSKARTQRVKSPKPSDMKLDIHYVRAT